MVLNIDLSVQIVGESAHYPTSTLVDWHNALKMRSMMRPPFCAHTCMPLIAHKNSRAHLMLLNHLPRERHFFHFQFESVSKFKEKLIFFSWNASIFKLEQFLFWSLKKFEVVFGWPTEFTASKKANNL